MQEHAPVKLPLSRARAPHEATENLAPAMPVGVVQTGGFETSPCGPIVATLAVQRGGSELGAPAKNLT